MCKKKQFKYCPSKIDECMKGLIIYLKRNEDLETLGCCCGHDKYPLTVVVKNKHGLIYELLSSKVIPRKKKFYKKDSKGYYYIPEVVNEKKFKSWIGKSPGKRK